MYPAPEQHTLCHAGRNPLLNRMGTSTPALGYTFTYRISGFMKNYSTDPSCHKSSGVWGSCVCPRVPGGCAHLVPLRGVGPFAKTDCNF